MLSNLYSMGLNELSILDDICLHIHPVYLTSFRLTCKLFEQRVKFNIAKLYQRWVINLPLETIKIDTAKWEFKHLINCALIINPTPESIHLDTRKYRRMIMNGMINGCEEDVCIQLFHAMYENLGIKWRDMYLSHMGHNLIFLSWKYGYHKFRSVYLKQINRYCHELGGLQHY